MQWWRDGLCGPHGQNVLTTVEVVCSTDLDNAGDLPIIPTDMITMLALLLLLVAMETILKVKSATLSAAKVRKSLKNKCI